jgi:Uncharacterized protein conserved in bacteria
MRRCVGRRKQGEYCPWQNSASHEYALHIDAHAGRPGQTEKSHAPMRKTKTTPARRLLLDRYGRVADGIALLFFPYVEIVIHDLQSQTGLRTLTQQPVKA